MGGFDKVILMRELEALGWTRPEEPDCGSLAGYCLIPPDSLWENKPKQFYVYDARDLQDLLGEEE